MVKSRTELSGPALGIKTLKYSLGDISTLQTNKHCGMVNSHALKLAVIAKAFHLAGASANES